MKTQYHTCGDLVGQLHDAGLLDEVFVQVGSGFAELHSEVAK